MPLDFTYTAEELLPENLKFPSHDRVQRLCHGVVYTSKEVTVAGTGKAVSNDTNVLTSVTVDDIFFVRHFGWLKLNVKVKVLR